MKKTLLIAGILLIAAGVLCLLTGWLFWNAFRNTLDASPDFYHRRERLAWKHFGVGAAVTAAGVVCLLFRRRVR